MADFFGRTRTFVLDTETNVVKSFIDRRCRLIQIGNRDEQYLIDLLGLAGSPDELCKQGNYQTPSWATELVAILRQALDSNKWLKVGVNLQFDYEVLHYCLGVQAWNFYDCLLAEKCIHAGVVGFFEPNFWGMKDMVARYLKVAIAKDLQTSFNLTDPLTPEQIQYAALDARLPLALQNCQLQILKKDGLMRAAQIEFDAIPAFGDMHLRGFKLDPNKWGALEESNKAIYEASVKALDTQFIPHVGTKHRPMESLEPLEKAWRDEQDREKRAEARKAYQQASKKQREFAEKVSTCAGEALINYASGPQLIEVLRKLGLTPKKLPNTDDRTLKKLSSMPIIAALRQYRKAAKNLTTYSMKFVEAHLNPHTGRVHSNIDQFGAATARTTSSDPNIQNIPGRQEVRDCFVAELGWKLITADYNGCELRIIAEGSQEPAWVNAFRQGWDVHSVGAEILFGKVWADATEADCAYAKDHQKCECKGHVKLRKQIKAINFGIAYGMEAGKLADELGIPVAEAMKLLKLYRRTFPKVTAYLHQLGEYAKLHAECRTLAGSRRRFERPTWDEMRATAKRWAVEKGTSADRVTHDDINRAYWAAMGSIEREGKNTPIQGTNAYMVKLAVGCGFEPEQADTDSTAAGTLGIGCDGTERVGSAGAGYLWHRLRPYGAHLVNIVHDELVVESPKEVAEVVEKEVGDCMVRAGAAFVKSIPMTYESKIADCWSK